MVRSFPWVVVDELSVAILCDVIVLTCRHARRRGKPTQDILLSGRTRLFPGKGGKSFNDRMEDRVGRRRRIQIIDVAGGFEALTDRCQYLGVLQVRLRDLQKNVSGPLYRQAAVADNSQQGICGFVLMMLGLS